MRIVVRYSEYSLKRLLGGPNPASAASGLPSALSEARCLTHLLLQNAPPALDAAHTFFSRVHVVVKRANIQWNPPRESYINRLRLNVKHEDVSFQAVSVQVPGETAHATPMACPEPME